MYCHSQCPKPCSRPPPAPASAGDSWTLAGKPASDSCGVTAPLSWVLVYSPLFVPSKSYFPVLCKFWLLYGVVSGDLLQEGLHHPQGSCTQSPCPCGSPLLTSTSTGDTQISVSVSVGPLGPGVHRVCLSPLWQAWCLILDVNLPLLPSC